MLEAYIIDKIKKMEIEKELHRPQLQIPKPERIPYWEEEKEENREPHCSVIVIDLY